MRVFADSKSASTGTCGEADVLSQRRRVPPAWTAPLNHNTATAITWRLP